MTRTRTLQMTTIPSTIPPKPEEDADEQSPGAPSYVNPYAETVRKMPSPDEIRDGLEIGKLIIHPPKLDEGSASAR